eukprot:TRINITY_DN999_c0_g1_i1.p1 TRINITY_DN999_c0_g1~~TRINITY_DN999_c0_g1_i1.p1  ORF type:complete len:651 (+),score=157.24 TRINITY_DN999_c0_g1_i1:118-1953(+)
MNDELISQKDQKTFSWYICGPTVYDSSHLGHARSYLSFDIIRRILTDYFKLNVNVCMNITDIDDKIIKKAQIAECDFRDIARRYEAEFFDDLKALNIERPTEEMTPHVSDYIEPIQEFILGLIDKGFAYVAMNDDDDKSVYFDSKGFDGSIGIDGVERRYGRLEPDSVFVVNERTREGETDLVNRVNERRDFSDFALWKAAKPGEPSFDSPWGKGRPGWHIECSVMSTSIFGERLDIHCGGMDLRFPHHDNEIAQTEAFYGISQWTNYFMHCGTLKIKKSDGQLEKMSKSLKNFITIRQCLEQYTARQIRMLFLMHPWDSQLAFGETTMEEPIYQDDRFMNFFWIINALLREIRVIETEKTETEEAIEVSLREAQAQVHLNLQNNFDTMNCILVLSSLVDECNKYIEKQEKDNEKIHLDVLCEVRKFVYEILTMFGLVYCEPIFIDDLSDILEEKVQERSNLRETANSDKKNNRHLFEECDRMRAELFEEGIRIKDLVNSTRWARMNNEDKKALQLAEERKNFINMKKAEAKAKAKANQNQPKAKKISDSTDPKVMFVDDDRYDQESLREDGVPTRFSNGEEIGKKKFKKIEKLHQQQKDKYEQYLLANNQ